MKSKSVILLFVSLGFGLIAAIGISQVMGRNGVGGDSIRKSPVLIAKDFIEINQELTEELVKLEEWPVNIIPENSATTMDMIKNKVATHIIPKGAPIFNSNIIDKSKSGALPIREGHRFLAIKVGAEDIANGLMRPGDRVDVMGVFDRMVASNKVMVTSTFLRNILVLSVNDSTSADGGPREANASKTVSIVGLSVTPKQAEQVALVQKAGTVKLSLRPPSNGNEDQEEQGDPLPSFLFGGAAPGEIASPSPFNFANPLSALMGSRGAQTQKSQESFVMKIWNGAKQEQYTFRQDGSIVPPETLQAEHDQVEFPLDEESGEFDEDQEPDSRPKSESIESD